MDFNQTEMRDDDNDTVHSFVFTIVKELCQSSQYPPEFKLCFSTLKIEDIKSSRTQKNDQGIGNVVLSSQVL